MKALIQKTVVSCIILCFFSCQKHEPQFSIVESDFDHVKEKIYKLGFDTTKVARDGSSIIVEGDIVFNLDELLKTSSRQASSVNIYGSVYPITYNKQRNVRYYVNSNAASWESATQAAFSRYNSLQDFNLRFYQTTNITEADIQITSGANPGAYAEAKFPSNGMVGSFIRVNTNYSNLPESKKLFIIAHEIGHTIGFRHTDWRGVEREFDAPEGVSVGAYSIPGTPNNSPNPDPNSIFNSGRGFNDVPNFINFSNFDLIALNYMYPRFLQAKLITSPNNSLPAYSGMDINAHVEVSNWREGNLTYEWFVQGVQVISQNGASIHVVVTNPTSAALSCTIRNAYGETISASKSFGELEIN